MSRPNFRRRKFRAPRIRTNERIRVREVRVVDAEGSQVGVMPTEKAIQMARAHGLDLVEVTANTRPPICRICDFGKYKYEQAKKEKEHKKTQHVNKVKEIQLRPFTDPHDYQYKLQHAIDFLCEDMKVKVLLRFRGRENAHKEYGFDTMKRFVTELKLFGKTDSEPRKAGRGITVMVAPLPASKRAKNPNPRKQQQEDMAQKIQKDKHGENGAGDSENLNNAFADLEVPEESQA